MAGATVRGRALELWGSVRVPQGDFARWTGVTLLFSLAAIVQTWPLVLHATDSIINWPLRPEDSWQNLWNLWWVRHALVDIHTNPFHTDLLFFPQGADLYLYTLMPVNGVLSIPLQLVTNNDILSWNMLALILFVLSGLTAYALSYRVNRNHAAALVSGYIFAFSPFVLMHFHGHWNISTVWPIPLFALFLLRFKDAGRLKDAVAAGVCWALLSYTSLEYAVDAGLFLGLFFAYWSFAYLREGDWLRLPALWRGVLVIVGASFAVGAPLLIPALLSMQRGDVFMPQGDEIFSSDLLALITPSPLWGPGKFPVTVPPGLNHFPTGDIENTVYLGITALILATLAVLSIRRLSHRAAFWAVVFLFFVALAMGPYLYVGDTKEFSLAGVHFCIPMPYHIYDQIPVISERRVIARLIVFGILALSVLAGTGVSVLMSWLSRHWERVVPLAGLIIFSLVVLEFWNPPASVSELETPAIFEDIRDEPGDFTVLHAPLGRSTWQLTGNQAGALLADYYQRIHGKPTFGGYLSRAPASTLVWILEQPGLKYLSCPTCPGLPSEDDMNPVLVKELFRRYGIRYVALHRLSPHGWQIIGASEFQSLDFYLSTVLGLTPVHSDPSFTLYRNQD